MCKGNLSLSLENKDEWSHHGRMQAITKSQETSTRHKMNVLEASVTERSGSGHGPLLSHAAGASVHKRSAGFRGRPGNKCITPGNQTVRSTRGRQRTGEMRLEVNNKGYVALAESRPSLPSPLKAHNLLDQEPVWKAFLLTSPLCLCFPRLNEGVAYKGDVLRFGVQGQTRLVILSGR